MSRVKSTGCVAAGGSFETSTSAAALSKDGIHKVARRVTTTVATWTNVLLPKVTALIKSMSICFISAQPLSKNGSRSDFDEPLYAEVWVEGIPMFMGNRSKALALASWQ